MNERFNEKSQDKKGHTLALKTHRYTHSDISTNQQENIHLK